jgi:hypothetical protein
MIDIGKTSSVVKCQRNRELALRKIEMEYKDNYGD